MSAVMTDRLGNFLNADLEPRVAASLEEAQRNWRGRTGKENVRTYHSRPNPLSLFASSSGVKNMPTDD